jgi:outer membrane biosynthesis protein TonB
MSYEIECPVCDRKASASATICHYCGADLKMASFDDLEEVAISIAAGKSSAPKSEPKSAAPKPESKVEPPTSRTKEEPEKAKAPVKPKEAAPEPKAEKPAVPEVAKEEKKEEEKHGLGRLFGKKKK